MPSQATTALIASWRLSLHGKTPATVNLYLYVATAFAKWLEAHRDDDDLTTVTRRDLEAWFSDQRDRGLAPATMRNRWIALRTLYKWLADVDEIAGNPMLKVEVARADPGPVRVPSLEALNAILATCTSKSFLDRRDRALLRFLAVTGTRTAECVALNVGDVDLVARTVHVRKGKGGKVRTVRIDQQTATYLDAYLRARARHPMAHLANLWVTQFGGLSRKGLPMITAARSARAGVEPLNPHALRHFFADQWLRAGGGEGDLLRLGGWENADVMRRYGRTHAVERALNAYDMVNPGAGLEARP